jgi:uncharacterized protein YcaQ
MSDSESEVEVPVNQKKARSQKQEEATAKAFAAMKARREALAQEKKEKVYQPAPKEIKQKREPAPEPAPAPAPAPVPVGLPVDMAEFTKQIIMALRPTGPADPIPMKKARKPRQAKPVVSVVENKVDVAINEPGPPSVRHTGIREPPAGSIRVIERDGTERVYSGKEQLMNNFKQPATVRGLKGTDLLDKLFFSR